MKQKAENHKTIEELIQEIGKHDLEWATKRVKNSKYDGPLQVCIEMFVRAEKIRIRLDVEKICLKNF